MARKIKIHEEDAKNLLIIALGDAIHDRDGLSWYRELIVDIFDSVYPQLSQGLQGFILSFIESNLDEYFKKYEGKDDYPGVMEYWKRFYDRVHTLKQEIPYNNPDLVRGPINERLS